MSIKLKALGLGVFAMLAMGAFGAMNAGADGNGHTGGHFVSEATNTNIVGEEGPDSAHNLLFSTDAGRPIDCTVSTYTGTTNAKTVTSVTVAPKYENCDTAAPIEPPHNVTVHTNGCHFEFTVNTNPTTTHNAVHVKGCNSPSGITVTHPNCTMRMPEQTVTGATYTNVTTTTPDGTKHHEVTLDSTVTNITAHYEGGFCVFLGTTHKGEMKGSATVKGFDPVTGNQVDVTATGPQTTAAEKDE